MLLSYIIPFKNIVPLVFIIATGRSLLQQDSEEPLILSANYCLLLGSYVGGGNPSIYGKLRSRYIRRVIRS